MVELEDPLLSPLKLQQVSFNKGYLARYHLRDPRMKITESGHLVRSRGSTMAGKGRQRPR